MDEALATGVAVAAPKMNDNDNADAVGTVVASAKLDSSIGNDISNGKANTSPHPKNLYSIFAPKTLSEAPPTIATRKKRPEGASRVRGPRAS